MNNVRRIATLGGLALAVVVSGCASPKVGLSALQRPSRPAELGAFDFFVGSWDWEADVLGSDDPDTAWTGRATWSWTLDDRCLRGTMSARGAQTEFESEGIWSWNPKTGKYIWWMFNDWGYPQEGTATYDADSKTWTMKYRSTGLDGSRSYGRYRLAVADKDTIDWRMEEWADALHLIKKIEMTGTYKRTN